MMHLRAFLVLALSCLGAPALAQTSPGTSPLTVPKGGTNCAAASGVCLDNISGFSSAGMVARTGSGSYAFRTLTPPAAGLSITNPAGTAGNPTFSFANDLAALEALASTGIAVRITTDAWAQRTLQPPAAGLSITNPAGVAGDPTFAFANDLAALEALSGTGIARRTGADAWSLGTVVGLAEGGTGQTTAQNARASGALNVDSFTPRSDSNYSILATDRTVGTNAAFTASRTWTLPAANAVNAGQEIIVADFQGTVTASNTLVIARAGSDTINGGTAVTITAANGAYLLKSDGSSKWTAQALGAAAAGGVSSVTCGTGLTGGIVTTSGTCAVDYASKSDQQTGTSTSKNVNPARQIDHDSAAKAWVNFVGSTGAINMSSGVSGIVKNSTGNYTISFTTPFTNATYSCQATLMGTAAMAYTTAITTGSIVFQALTAGAAVVDPVAGSLVCYGRQ